MGLGMRHSRPRPEEQVEEPSDRTCRRSCGPRRVRGGRLVCTAVSLKLASLPPCADPDGFSADVAPRRPGSMASFCGSTLSRREQATRRRLTPV